MPHHASGPDGELTDAAENYVSGKVNVVNFDRASEKVYPLGNSYFNVRGKYTWEEPYGTHPGFFNATFRVSEDGKIWVMNGSP